MSNGQPEFDFVVVLLYGKKEYSIPVLTRTPKLAVSMAVAILCAELNLVTDEAASLVVPTECRQLYPVTGRCEKCRQWCFTHEIGARNKRVLCEVCK